MGSRIERKRLVGGGGYKHSLNQEAVKWERDRGKKGFGRLDKIMKARKRQLRIENQLLEDRTFAHAVSHVLDGASNPADVKYVLDRIGKYERRLETFHTKKSKVITTIVDLRSNNKV